MTEQFASVNMFSTPKDWANWIERLTCIDQELDVALKSDPDI